VDRTFILNISLFSGIVISLKMLHGELLQVREENPILFKNISLTRKLGFSDVIMPGDVRLV
jgi:dedicator of cytokinesis protein 3